MGVTFALAPGKRPGDDLKKVLIPEILAGVAQLVEQLICNQLVGGSSPSIGSAFLTDEIIGMIKYRGVRYSWRGRLDCKSNVSAE